MSVFKRPTTPEDRAQLDWSILSHGPVAKYQDRTFLDQDLEWFRGNGYTVHLFDCARWTSEEEFHIEIEQTLNFPGYYGRNLDAFHECIVCDTDVPDEGGMVLAFLSFDQFSGKFPRTARYMLDAIAIASRSFSLTGQRLIALVQLDVDVEFDYVVGGTGIGLNDAERAARLTRLSRIRALQDNGQ